MLWRLRTVPPVPAGTANLRYIRPNDSASPPTPDNIGNYQPSTDAELRFLPPVN